MQIFPAKKINQSWLVSLIKAKKQNQVNHFKNILCMCQGTETIKAKKEHGWRDPKINII